MCYTQSTSQFSPSRLFQNAVLEFLGLYWAGDLIVLLFCAWQILSGRHICHKSKLTHYMWLKSSTQMTKMCTKAFLHKDTDHCALAFRGVTWNIGWAHAVNSCQGWTCHGGLNYGYHLFAFCPRGLIEDKTKQESHYHKALTNPWSSSLATLLTLLCSTAGWCGLQDWGSRVIQQIQSLLVGNLKSPNGRDPVTTAFLPESHDTWSIKSWKSQTLQFQCTGRIVLNSVSNYW